MVAKNFPNYHDIKLKSYKSWPNTSIINTLRYIGERPAVWLSKKELKGRENISKTAIRYVVCWFVAKCYKVRENNKLELCIWEKYALKKKKKGQNRGIFRWIRSSIFHIILKGTSSNRGKIDTRYDLNGYKKLVQEIEYINKSM